MTPGSNAAVFFGEFIGTAILLLMGNGVVAAVLLPRSKAFAGGWIVITFGWGFAVLAGAYTALNLSGGQINPAVTLGLSTFTGEGWDQVPLRLVAQVLGGIVGAALCWAAYMGHFRVAEEDTLGIFSTIPAIRNNVQNFVTEVIGTFVLVLFIIATGPSKLPAGGERTGEPIATAITQSGTGVLLVALLVVGIGLCLGGPTGYAINPARDLGPRIAYTFLPIPNKTGSDWGYSWVPVAGPIVGGVLAALVGKAVL
ncbi:MAG TPA: MIP/aquaporin family protein [Streptosporangiaceae bacterium]|jgi:glycerol uptake facilitator protein|nr:MIP/aquaporin family protein [Streptosporangiaceae bacterium]